MIMRARVVYFEGCPGHEPAVALLREVARDLHVDLDIEKVRVETPEEAVRERMLGSPTIQIDGVDIEPAARTRTDFAMSCRIYPGKQGLPPREMVEAALKGENWSPDAQDGASAQSCEGECCCNEDKP